MSFFSSSRTSYLALGIFTILCVTMGFYLILTNVQKVGATDAPMQEIPNFGIVPKAGSALARQIDRQISGGMGKSEGGGADGFSMIVTVPADINNLEQTNPLSRQVAEEMARWFVQAGYHVNDVRMGSNVLIDPEKTELILSRKASLLRSNRANVMGVLVGTYTTTRNNIRFNVRMVQANGNEVLGMATVTIPLDQEARGLLVNRDGGGAAIMPSVLTRLPLADSSKP
ncbi:FlgO family outer membrane protein [Desulfovibrio litoralis]|uniref:FlgO domain-containing protein n=1 Tax=Desulfovibrio litoralis DSM 11393 TaxID=1121455 RepID=A0A1M7T6E1_9BACT|nr:FlgO family outer membrane protein [Desulfovibrio litoralis]SHN66277.1 hypothetical protein SAMN02745728_01607 [Desulfovibrio litoralis DSM 11393]